jgi:hypothetical protein
MKWQLSGDARAVLISIVVASLVLLGATPPSYADSKSSAPVQLEGNGIASLRFGASQSVAVDQVETLFGTMRTVTVKPEENCRISAESSTSNVEVFFEDRRFVGYEIGSAMAKIIAKPAVVTAAGLRIGDSIRQARKIYGAAFSTSSAQGGSWSVQTTRGRLMGLLVGPPVPIGISDRIELVAAGYVGCPAMTP